LTVVFTVLVILSETLLIKDTILLSKEFNTWSNKLFDPALLGSNRFTLLSRLRTKPAKVLMSALAWFKSEVNLGNDGALDVPVAAFFNLATSSVSVLSRLSTESQLAIMINSYRKNKKH
jgi:hypothetical protein